MSLDFNKKLIFWQSTPSPHQAAYIRAMGNLKNIEEVRLYLFCDFEKQRHAMGWHHPDYGHIPVTFRPDGFQVASTIGALDGNSVQIFSEFISDPRVYKILQSCLKGQGLIGLLSEGRDWRGLKGWVRQVHGIFCERRLASRVNFVLAIGELARKWYLRCGYSPAQIFDFCYVVENYADTAQLQLGYQEPLRLLFVGQLIPRKNPNLLLKALSILSSKPWKLRIIGTGPEIQSLVALSKHQGFSDKVEFMGSLDNLDVFRELANADILVLPSHWDGWGAVVNEALMCGTRVICSDYCGAADLIKDTKYGSIFTSGSPDSLADALDQEFKKGPVTGKERLEIMRYADSIRGESIAKYLYEIIEFVSDGYKGLRPIPPWKRQ